MKCEALCQGTSQGFVSRFRVICSRLISDDASLSREPQCTVVLDDVHDIMARHLKGDTIKAIPLRIVAAQSAKRADPQPSSLIYQRAVYLVAGQGILVFVVVLVLLELLVFYAIAP